MGIAQSSVLALTGAAIGAVGTYGKLSTDIQKATLARTEASMKLAARKENTTRIQARMQGLKGGTK